mmetsp:Transcript_18097/g.25353  ORF Transcript_18097/g.25353 Transcript_18097/m.25353 type:complete len:138 (+) Transcript_18097:99-512(+)
MAADPHNKLKRKIGKRVTSARKIYERNPAQQEEGLQEKEQYIGTHTQKPVTVMSKQQQHKYEIKENDRVIVESGEVVNNSTSNDSPTCQLSSYCDNNEKEEEEYVKEKRQSDEAEENREDGDEEEEGEEESVAEPLE